MTTGEVREELLPLRVDFDRAWRGYDRAQVQGYVREAETGTRLLAADRDAAVARAEDLARQLEEAREQVRELRAKVDRISGSPVDVEALEERLRRRVELAHRQAEEITARARAAAERTWADADRAAASLREQWERLVGEQHEATRATREEAEAAAREAAEQRRELDEQSALLRAQVESDFTEAMRARRGEALAALARRDAESRAEAERLVAEAAEHAAAIVAEAERRVAELKAGRQRVAEQLLVAQRMLSDAQDELEPLPEEQEPQVPHLVAV
ncbi:hypothetical protein [Actinosynnema pretiosum]|uniref:Cellulose-binding protein n=1 Tax=Actinosynnema pretiosum TaxID=42197 RepID=A0A290Z896_9PSEU|nr:hypothetical protein [Actinosynnema pretiosum]ATE55247.1 hypothetical protein CNX65_19795 [Actinosynnema pretiosum]